MSNIKEGVHIFCCLFSYISKRSDWKGFWECDTYLTLSISENLLLTKFRANFTKIRTFIEGLIIILSLSHPIFSILNFSNRNFLHQTNITDIPYMLAIPLWKFWFFLSSQCLILSYCNKLIASMRVYLLVQLKKI